MLAQSKHASFNFPAPCNVHSIACLPARLLARSRANTVVTALALACPRQTFGPRSLFGRLNACYLPLGLFDFFVTFWFCYFNLFLPRFSMSIEPYVCGVLYAWLLSVQEPEPYMRSSKLWYNSFRALDGKNIDIKRINLDQSQLFNDGEIDAMSSNFHKDGAQKFNRYIFNIEDGSKTWRCTIKALTMDGNTDGEDEVWAEKTSKV